MSLSTTGGALDAAKTVATVALPADTGIHVFAVFVA